MIDNKTIRKVIMLNKILKGGSPIYENREAEGVVANFETNTVQPFVKCECTIDATESGTDELTLTKTGKNLFNISEFASLYPQYCTYEDDVLNVQGNVVLYSTGVEVKAPTGAKLSATITDITSANARFRLVYTDGSYSDVYPNQLPFSLLKDLAFVRLNWSTNGTFKIENAQIELGSTATTYEPYIGSTYTVALEETAYGGSVDVIAGSGQIIDEHGDLVYTLFEPVSISALEGVNNVWTDSGDTKVTYKYKTGEGGSSNKKYLPIFYDFYGKDCRHL